ncbi:hypothetical protein BV20DRAFT_1058423 [Pilatotrama ljubarskyi]|nr:hypothetical protein BV20DRAFT_1058423 [Pilatotrama ljubarskyi]
MICSLELESSPALREAFLRNWLVNPSGEPGRTIEGDLLQEHLNLELEEAITRKGAEWDSKFIRQVISPNVYHFVELKNYRPEIKTLLATYKDAELHCFRPGRSHRNWKEVKSNFEAGVVNLEKKKLKKFISDSTRARSVLLDTHTAQAGGQQCQDVTAEDASDEDEHAPDDEVDADTAFGEPTLGTVALSDVGLLVVDVPALDNINAPDEQDEELKDEAQDSEGSGDVDTIW